MARNYYEIAEKDVGKVLISAFGRQWPVADFIGRIMEQDVGKRVYRVGSVRDAILQVENDEQFKKRVGARGRVGTYGKLTQHEITNLRKQGADYVRDGNAPSLDMAVLFAGHRTKNESDIVEWAEHIYNGMLSASKRK